MTETKDVKPEPPEGFRYLDDAVGGGLAPIGPLGGPKPQTREEMLAKQELDSEASTEAERQAIDKAKVEIKANEAKVEAVADAGPLA